MTTLKELLNQVGDWIEEYGQDYELACFFIKQDEIQAEYISCNSDCNSAEELEGQPDIERLTQRQLSSIITHLEHDGTAYAKLFGVPLHEAIDAHS
jgi:5,10-methylene-tetrahydrofolate dehydrogenase/methenyl tetrahydrofolate cyclohydrolase